MIIEQVACSPASSLRGSARGACSYAVKPTFSSRSSSVGFTVEPYQPDGAPESVLVATFSDPDDNYFQLLSPT